MSENTRQTFGDFYSLANCFLSASANLLPGTVDCTDLCATVVTPTRNALLTCLTNFRTELTDLIATGITDGGYLAQLQRLLCIVDNLINRVQAIICDNDCRRELGELLCVLTKIIKELVAISIKLAVITRYRGACATISGCPDNVDEVLVECLLCDLVNEICELECLTNDLARIIIAMAVCDFKDCTPCYVAPWAPKYEIPNPPYPPQCTCKNPRPNYPHNKNCGCNKHY